MSLRTTRQYTEVLHPGDGALRTTHQYVEVLHPGDGAIRAARQYVEVLYVYHVPETFEVDCTDTVEVSESTAINKYYLTAIDTVDVGESASRLIVASAMADDTLDFSETARRLSVVYIEAFDAIRPSEFALRLSYSEDTLTVSESADRQHIANISVSDSLSDLTEAATRQLKIYCIPAPPLTIISITDSAQCGGIYNRSSSDTFAVSEIASVEKIRPALDSLTLSETAEAVVTQHSVDMVDLSDLAEAHKLYLRESFDAIRPRDTANGGFEYACEATDTVDLDDAAQIQRDASDSLTISDSADAVAYRPAIDTLTLSDLATAYNCTRRLTEPAIELSDEASVSKVYYRSASDDIDITETVNWTGPKYLEASDTVQDYYIEYGDGPEYEETVVYVDLAEEASATVVLHRTLLPSDEIELTDSAEAFILNSTQNGTATDTLLLSDSASITYLGDGSDVITLSDAAVVDLAKPAEDSVDLSETATCSVVFSRTIVDTVDLDEAILVAFESLDEYTCVYHPFVGTGPSSNPTPPPSDLDGPIVGITVPFQLVYPVMGPFSDTLTLRAPNLGNRDRFQANRISRETRGGSLIVFADPIWPKIKTLVLKFSGLTFDEAQGLHTFMNTHLGQEIGLMDWEHRFWSGVITNLADPIVKDGRGSQYSVGFEFEGELTTYSP